MLGSCGTGGKTRTYRDDPPGPERRQRLPRRARDARRADAGGGRRAAATRSSSRRRTVLVARGGDRTRRARAAGSPRAGPLIDEHRRSHGRRRRADAVRARDERHSVDLDRRNAAHDASRAASTVARPPAVSPSPASAGTGIGTGTGSGTIIPPGGGFTDYVRGYGPGSVGTRFGDPLEPFDELLGLVRSGAARRHVRPQRRRAAARPPRDRFSTLRFNPSRSCRRRSPSSASRRTRSCSATGTASRIASQDPQLHGHLRRAAAAGAVRARARSPPARADDGGGPHDRRRPRPDRGPAARVPLHATSSIRRRSTLATVQSFGGQLLAALEKGDAEELEHLRAVHEQNLLALRRRARAARDRRRGGHARVAAPAAGGRRVPAPALHRAARGRHAAAGAQAAGPAARGLAVPDGGEHRAGGGVDPHDHPGLRRADGDEVRRQPARRRRPRGRRRARRRTRRSSTPAA